MYGFVIMQNNARAHSLHNARTTNVPAAERDIMTMTPPTTPTPQQAPSNFVSDQQFFSKPQSLNQHQPQQRRSPKVQSRPKDSTRSKIQLKKNEIELLKKSWLERLEPSDPFDIVGDHYKNISDACYSSEFWERCLEEIRMTNIQIEDSKSFVAFYSNQFADTLKLSLDNANDLEKLRDFLEATGKRHKRQFNSSDSFFELFRISFLSTLMDSFADAFTSELQTSWRNLLVVIVDLMDLNKQNSNLLKEIEEETASMLGNDSMSFISADSVLDSTSGSSIFTRNDSTRTTRTSATSRSVSTNTPPLVNKNAKPPPAIASFYTKPPSLNRKSSLSSLRSKDSTNSKMKSSAVSIADSTNSTSSSITTTSTGQKLYKGKPIPLFMQLDLQRIATQGSSGSSSSSSTQSPSLSESSTSKKSKANKFFNALLFPTGNMGPLIP